MHAHSARRNVSQSTILPLIRRLVLEVQASGKPLKDIAADASVDYQALRRFIVGTTEVYNATSAEKVFYSLTGKSFSPPTVAIRRKAFLKKGGKAA